MFGDLAHENYLQLVGQQNLSEVSRDARASYTQPFRSKELDLTLDGCFAVMLFMLNIGFELNIDLSLEIGRISAARIVVRRFHKRGKGIRFTDGPPEEHSRLKQLLVVQSAT